MGMSIRALVASLMAAWAPVAQATEANPWSALRQGGAVAIIRHARAPGTGDPPGFRLGDCTTQRNLDGAGRKEAAALGDRFRAERVAVASVRSSRWCRAGETARLAFPDLAVEETPALDSFFDDRGSAGAQTDAARSLILGWRGSPATLVLVTHQVNVTALTGIVPREGEVVVVRAGPDGALAVVGRLTP